MANTRKRLRDGLAATAYNLPRGNGEKSIPWTGGDEKDPFRARPASANFYTKSEVLSAASVDFGRGKLFLGRVDNKMVGVADGRHIVTLAGSGGGKSVCSLICNLKLYDGSMLVLDPKGELAAATAKERAAMGQAVHVLDPFNVSGEGTREFRTSFDPLYDLQQDREYLIENADLVADALIIPSKGETHWTDAARSLVRALVLLLLLDPKNSGGSLSNLPRLITRITAEMRENRRDDGTTTLIDDLATLDPRDMPDAEQEAWAIVQSQAEMMQGMGAKERASVLSTARTQLIFLDSPAMAAIFKRSPLLLSKLKGGYDGPARYSLKDGDVQGGKRNGTIYLCLPAGRMGTHSRWLRLIINLAIVALEREPTPQTPDFLPVLFMLEEFAALGHMKTLESAVAYMRGFGVKLWAVLQDLTQLKRDYPESWETFLGNAGIVQAFSVNDLTTQKYLSDRLGKTTLQITNKHDVSSSASMSGETGLKREFREAQLLGPDEVGLYFAHKVDGEGRAMGGPSLVLWSGKPPFMVERVFHGDLV